MNLKYFLVFSKKDKSGFSGTSVKMVPSFRHLLYVRFFTLNCNMYGVYLFILCLLSF